ncbi:MAG: 3',5'-cyclic-nucleotide phosphodiesterase [Sclerophora amabilis]|nr:MAG: 3',5'-cyclic-nucleotide phosphodiesterase [Sclerophora amabilis]
MDYATCSVIYVDRRARDNTTVRTADLITPTAPDQDSLSTCVKNTGDQGNVAANVESLLAIFQEVYLCSSGSSCRSKVSQLNDSTDNDLVPTLVFIDIPLEDNLEKPPHDRRSLSPRSQPYLQTLSDPGDETLYGTKLLQYIVSQIQLQNLSKLIVPIAAVSSHKRVLPPAIPSGGTPATKESSREGDYRDESEARDRSFLDTGQTIRFLDAGAVDALVSPFLRERIISCATHAYKARKEVAQDQKAFLAVKRGRKRSWVGVDEEKPYSYLREAMVSGLMDGICKPQSLGEIFEQRRLHVLQSRQDVIAQAIGSWSFSGHDFSEDELLHAALLMLQHALSIQELEQWRIPTEHLKTFLIATRTAYNSFVPYHNFRHVVDVLQAVFYFLLQIGTLPEYPIGKRPRTSSSASPMAALLGPFEALTLLISAIGHDVGHPGVNNAFLVTLNAPLAQLYNDQSVLESFHCAAFSQILRRYWPASFHAAGMRKLLIRLILATDMGLHFDYMKKMGYCQEKLYENGGTDGWDGRLVEEQRTLACSLLIKCADISNVARKFDVAAKWATILTDEFARQASMENDLEIPSALFAPPIQDSVVELGKSQIGFMNLFALPLFQGVTDILPAMKFSVDQMQANKKAWEIKIDVENNSRKLRPIELKTSVSPRSGSPAATAQAKHGDGARPSHISPPPIFQAPGKDTHNGIRRPAGEPARNAELPTTDLPSQSSTIGSSLPSEDMVDTRSRNSAGAFRTGSPPPSQTRSSSNTLPSQKQLDIGSTEARPPSADHSLVAVLVTSQQKIPKTADSQTKGNGRRKSSEKSSLPSTQDRHSQTTSPTNIAYSPTTQGTSFLSVDSTEKAGLDEPILSRPEFAQELLSTFSTALGEVALIPATGGTFVVEIEWRVLGSVTSGGGGGGGGGNEEDEDGSGKGGGGGGGGGVGTTSEKKTLWDRKVESGFPETKELKRRVRDVIEPGRDLGHVDRRKEVEVLGGVKEPGGAGEAQRAGVDDPGVGTQRGTGKEDCKTCD